MSGADLIRALDELLDKGAHAADGLSPDEAQELAALASVAQSVRELGPAPAPRPEFRRRLAAQLASAPPPRSLDVGSVRRSPRLWRRRLALSSAMMAAVLVFVSVGAIQASAGALPGQTLYPVKRAVERARMSFAGAGELMLHLELARTRLVEAIAVPSAAGKLLAEFSREVTSALAAADAAMASGATRDEIGPPLLDWLLGARGDLVAYRELMPPMAWRGALALVDEAIATLRSGDSVALRPVPRLERTDLVLARWAFTKPWDRPIGGGMAPLPPVIAALGAGQSASQRQYVVVPGPAGDSGGPSGGDQMPAVPTLPPPTEQPAPRPTRGEAGGDVPTAEPEPTQPAATPTMVPPTPDLPSPAPTDEPTATVIPANQPPVIVAAWCMPNPVVVYTSAQCSLEVQDPDDGADQMRYEWTADAGEMLRPTARVATYYASFDHGVKETTTWITVRAWDPDDASAEFRFLMRVVAGEQGGAVPSGTRSGGP